MPPRKSPFWCSFGATVAAWLGANIMKAIELLNKVMGICNKLATLIEKIATLLKKVMEIVQKIQRLIQVIKSVFAAFKAFKNGDFLGGISSMSGAVSGYNSLAGVSVVMIGSCLSWVSSSRRHD